MGDGAGPQPDPSPDPAPIDLTPELLADLQAGLLDDATAARVRRRARSDPEAARTLAQLQSVRRELAQLGRGEGADQAPPDVPATVTARVSAALRAAPDPGAASAGGHTVSRPRLTRAQRAGLVIGVCAVATAVVLGALVLTRDPGPVFPAGPTAAQITVERTASSGLPSSDFPLSDAELRAALAGQQDLGPLADPQRRASCLTGLGYSPTLKVLGGHAVEVAGRPGVLLLVPLGTPDQIGAVVVEPTCNAADTGLLAETVLTAQ